VDALALSGGSVFGLDAAAGVCAGLRAMGRGFAVGPARAPIVAAAALFDLTNGGDKGWGLHAPYRELGLAALRAAGGPLALGSAGAGFGAQVGPRGAAGGACGLRGGLGAASAVDPSSGATVGALAAVNALGAATVGAGPWFWAAPFEIGAEFGGLGPAPAAACAASGPPAADAAAPRGQTTLAVVATDAALDRAGLRRLAVGAQDGIARALWPAHGPLDGDVAFAAATGRLPVEPGPATVDRLAALAAAATARAVARGVWAAAGAAGLPGLPPAWRERFGG
jgi:L-aminopeptidase/D-esterase-like protein